VHKNDSTDGSIANTSYNRDHELPIPVLTFDKTRNSDNKFVYMLGLVKIIAEFSVEFPRFTEEFKIFISNKSI